MPVNFYAQPGYSGQTGRPQGFADPELRRWTANVFHNARFGGEVRSDRLTGLITVHPVRAMELVGTTSTTPGELYDPFHGGLSDFILLGSSDFVQLQLGEPNGNVPHSAVSPVTLTVVSSGIDHIVNGAELWVNSQLIQTDVLLGTSGQDVAEGVDIPDYTWNDLVDEGLGFVNIILITRGENNVPQTGGFQFGLSYQSEDRENQPYIHKEVCFPHRGVGFLKRADRLFEPAAIYQPDRTADAMLTVGQAWIVKADEPSDVGTPRMTVLGCPFETPPTIEAIFSAYPAMCGTPTPGQP
jgi:hypothetical protein